MRSHVPDIDGHARGRVPDCVLQKDGERAGHPEILGRHRVPRAVGGDDDVAEPPPHVLERQMLKVAKNVI